MKIKFLLTMAIPLLLVACDKDGEGGGDSGGNASAPVTFTASIQPEAKTRVTVNNGWTGLADSKMAVSIDGTVKEYTVNEIGEVTSSEPFYWEDKETMTVDAWYPYNNGVKPETITVSADQSVAANYEKSDYLEAVGATVTPKKATLTFTHRTAKIVCTVTSTLGDAGDARIILHGLAGVDEGSSVIATDKCRALVVPQTLSSGTEFIEIQSDVVGKYMYALKEDLELKKACLYYVDVSITANGIDAVFTESSRWVADAETPDAQSPEANPGNGDNGWSGDSESSGGNSPEANPGNGNNGWSGDSESSGGNSLEANPDNGNGSWNGSGENANGGSPEANPGNGNGNWSGDNEEVTGTTDTTP